MFVFDVIITCKSTTTKKELLFEPKLLGDWNGGTECNNNKQKEQIIKYKCNEKVHGWKVSQTHTHTHREGRKENN